VELVADDDAAHKAAKAKHKWSEWPPPAGSDPRCVIMSSAKLQAALQKQDAQRAEAEAAANGPMQASAAAVAEAARIRSECDQNSYAAQLASSQARQTQSQHNPVAMQHHATECAFLSAAKNRGGD
jgi:hypothetical protein